MASQTQRLRKTAHSNPTAAPPQRQKVYILVMGLTGAGKSTFVSLATEDDSIPIGEDGDLDGVTQNVRDYILEYKHNGIEYDIHLIDSPGFDDGTASDAEVLLRIATFVNIIYKLEHTIAGVLYLHDITKGKMGGVGIRNVRMLEQLVGVDKWDHCTLVTTKWGCTTNPLGEKHREASLMTDPRYFKSMCESSRNARMTRFNGTRESAISIIKPHLGQKLLPAISLQMVDEAGPKLSLGETDAGRVIADGLRERLRAEQRTEELTELNRILEQKFDEALFKEYKEKRDKLKHRHNLNRAGRWATRGAIVSGGIVATIFTLGPGASVFALAPAFETIAKTQKRAERKQIAQLETDYKAESSHSQKLSRLGSNWLKDRKVKELKHLDMDGESITGSDISSLRTTWFNRDRKVKEPKHANVDRETITSSDRSSLDSGWTNLAEKEADAQTYSLSSA